MYNISVLVYEVWSKCMKAETAYQLYNIYMSTLHI